MSDESRETGQSMYPKLLFRGGFNDLVAFEIEERGYCDYACVALAENVIVPATFYDPVRLAQDFEAGLEAGDVCLAEPGLIIVPRLTVPHMLAAVERLHRRGYFHTLVPLHDEDTMDLS